MPSATKALLRACERRAEPMFAVTRRHGEFGGVNLGSFADNPSSCRTRAAGRFPGGVGRARSVSRPEPFSLNE